jgi:hypothetical protein
MTATPAARDAFTRRLIGVHTRARIRAFGWAAGICKLTVEGGALELQPGLLSRLFVKAQRYDVKSLDARLVLPGFAILADDRSASVISSYRSFRPLAARLEADGATVKKLLPFADRFPPWSFLWGACVIGGTSIGDAGLVLVAIGFAAWLAPPLVTWLIAAWMDSSRRLARGT